MLIEIKEGVVLKEINDYLESACQAVYNVFMRENNTPVMTSAAEGKHMEGSYHPLGLAWDFRAWVLPNAQRVADYIRNILRALDPAYDVVYGPPDHVDHIHVEYDMRRHQRLIAEKGGKNP
jgi:hypothetical protein